MTTEKKSETVKFRLTKSEYKKLTDMAYKENTDISTYIRNRLFLTNKQQAKQKNISDKFQQKQNEQVKLIVSGICASVNQIKANVDPEDALYDLEKGVLALCHTLN